MGERGPAAESKKLKLVKNTYRPDRDMNHPEPVASLPDPPEWLPKGAKQEWRERGPGLFELGLISNLDVGSFAAYCLAYDEVRETTALIEAEGRTFRTATGYISPHPAIGQRNKALLNLAKFGGQFGLSPASRTRIEVPAPPARQNSFSKHGRGDTLGQLLEELE